MLLPKALIHAAPQPLRVDCSGSPIQVGMGGSPWHVAVSSMLLCRAKRNPQVTAALFSMWPTPQTLAVSDTQLELLLRPLGLHRQRARQIQLMSARWHADWADLRDHVGVGAYVAAAVELFCFGCTYDTTCDHVLEFYADNYAGPGMGEFDGRWFVDGDEFNTPLEAYGAYKDRLSQARRPDGTVRSGQDTQSS